MQSLDGLNLLPPRPVMVDELPDLVRRRMMAPARPPPPNFGRKGATDNNLIVVDSPASPDPSSAGNSPIDSPTKRTTPSPPPVSPFRVQCQSPIYIPLQDQQFALPECSTANSLTLRDLSIGIEGAVCPTNPPSPPQAAAPRRGHAQSPPTSRLQRGRKAEPYRASIPSERSAFSRASQKGCITNLFEDFAATLPGACQNISSFSTSSTAVQYSLTGRFPGVV